jgi:hypothetical protein
MARGLNNKNNKKKAGKRKLRSTHTHTHARTHSLSLNLSPSTTPPKTPSNEQVHLPVGNAIRSWKEVWLRVMTESKKINWKQKKRKHDPREEKKFFYLHTKKKKCDAHHRAPELLTVCLRANSSSPELQIGSRKKHQGSPIEVLHNTHH